MNVITIEVPQMNDSFSRIILGGAEYQLRFTYNDTFDFWTFGVYTKDCKPLLVGLKIVPNFPLNLFARDRADLPSGLWIAKSKLPKIGHNDFSNGHASFNFVEAE